MKRFLPLIVFFILSQTRSEAQSFAVNDLVKLTSLSAKSYDKFMSKNGFVPYRYQGDTSLMATFVERRKRRNSDTVSERSIDFSQRNTSRFFAYNTNVKQEFLTGIEDLKNNGFKYDQGIDVKEEGTVIFQKRNLVVYATNKKVDEKMQYCLSLEEKAIPDMRELKYAEDLLQFCSHEFLATFFGEGNVKKDMYYFTEKELKKCSVLFGKTSRQVIFVWGDERNLTDLSYILVTKVAPTVEAVKEGWDVAKNEWKLRSGVYPGMSLKELVRLNEADFEIYGSQSEFAFMAKPDTHSKIDFQKTGIMLNCMGCNEENVFRRTSLSAAALVRQDFPMYVYDVVLFNSQPGELLK